METFPKRRLLFAAAVPTAFREAVYRRSLLKASLGTIDLRQATVLFLKADADLENKLEEARDRLRRTGDAGRCSRDRANEMVSRYFLGRLSLKAVWKDRTDCCWFEPRSTEAWGNKPSMVTCCPVIHPVGLKDRPFDGTDR